MKYEILENDYKRIDNKKLYRIRALKDFGDVQKGELGGYLEKVDNLSQFGNAWIYGNAEVCDDAEV